MNSRYRKLSLSSGTQGRQSRTRASFHTGRALALEPLEPRRLLSGTGGLNITTPPYFDPTAVSIEADVSGRNAASGQQGDGGQGGRVEVYSGENINVGTGAPPVTGTGNPSAPVDLSTNVTLQPGDHYYRQIVPNSAGDLPKITTLGNVRIFCQYVVQAEFIASYNQAKVAPEITVYAGQPLWVNPPSYVMQQFGAKDVFPTGHKIEVDMTPDAQSSCLDGGTFVFQTTANGAVTFDVEADGGDGADGGAGGAGGTLLVGTKFSWGCESSYGEVSANGGDGGDGVAGQPGGKGGNGGQIGIRSDEVYLKKVRACGGDGGDGHRGEDGKSGAVDGTQGSDGGEGGAGGAVYVDGETPFYSLEPLFHSTVCWGGSGGDGDDGGDGIDGGEGSRGGKGGDGGDGGKGGAPGRISHHFTEEPASEANRGGHGGDGGNGGEGCLVSPRYGRGGDGGNGGDVVGDGSPSDCAQFGSGGKAGKGGGDSGSPGPSLDGTPGESGAAKTGQPQVTYDMPDVEKTDQWTIMVYGALDNDLEAAGLNELNHLEDVNFAELEEGVNVLTLIDRIGPTVLNQKNYDTSQATIPSDAASSAWANWQDTRMGWVTHDGQRGTSTAPEFSTVLFPVNWPGSQGTQSSELDTDDPDTLSLFVKWAMAAAPAENYALIIRDHGVAWRGFATDLTDSSGNTVVGEITMDEMGKAFDDIDPIDVLVFDACVMQDVEVASELKGEVDYLVASQVFMGQRDARTPLGYETWPSELAANPSMTPEKFALAVNNAAKASTTPTISTLDMTKNAQKLSDLNQALNNFADVALSTATQKDWQIMLKARNAAFDFRKDGAIFGEHGNSEPFNIDLGMFLARVIAETPSTGIAQAAEHARQSLKDLVVPNTRKNGSGLDIYLPASSRAPDSKFKNDYMAERNFEFFKDVPRWKPFISQLVQEGDASRVGGLFSFLSADFGNTIATAHGLAVAAGEPIEIHTTIDTRDDVDFFQFTAVAGQLLSLEVRGYAAEEHLKPVLTIYGADQSTMLGQFGCDSNGDIDLEYFILPNDGTYYFAIASEGNSNPLAPVAGTSFGPYSCQAVFGDRDVLEPQVDLSTTTVDFGAISADTSAEQILTISNQGAMPLVLTGFDLPPDSPFTFSAPSPVFSLSGMPSEVVVPGYGTVEIPIYLRSTDLGTVSQDLSLGTNDPSRSTINLTLQATTASLRTEHLGTIELTSRFGMDLTSGDRWYEFQTTRDGYLTVVGTASHGTLSASLYDAIDGTPLTTTVATELDQRFDYDVLAGETYFIRLSGTAQDAVLTVANLVAVDGAAVTVYGTSSADTFEFSVVGESYRVGINGVEYDFASASITDILFNGTGNDAAVLTGRSDVEIARLYPDHGTFGDDGFLVSVDAVSSIEAHGGGGADIAFLYDSAGDDEFVSRKYYAKLSGDEFAIETFDFMYNHGYATTRDGGTDVAYMEDAETPDKFKFDWPNPGQFFGKMYGGGTYYNRAKYFEQIYATMTGVEDTVRLFGSDGDETFYGQRDESRLTGAGFDVTVAGYNTLTAYATKGNDIAYVEDSDEDDTTRARPHKIMLWGGGYEDPTYMITARKFDEYYLEANNGGYDRAKLHDSVLDDYLEASGNSASLSRDSGSLDLLYEAIGFEWVKVYGTEDTDEITNRNTSNVAEPLDFILMWYGQWE